MYRTIVNGVREPSETIAGCVEVYDEVIKNPAAVIEIAENMDSWRDAEVYSHEDGGGVDKAYRSNTILDINHDGYTTHPIFTHVVDLVNLYLELYSSKYSVSFAGLEPVQLLKYSPGEYYKEHYDTGPAFPRVISALLYLNDVEDGGQTRFVHFDEQVQPKAGRLVIFPSNYAYSHQALPPENHHKYVLVFWTTEFE